MPTPLIADRYEDLGPLGEGGMATVRRVRDVKLNRTLALKIMHASLVGPSVHVSRFTEEAQVTGQLQHPNIVPIHDLGRLDDGRLWYTMLEVQGRTLDDEITAHHASSDAGTGTRRPVAIFLSVCNAIAHAHERGVVHRDLKPNNVMVGEHGQTWVLDWGHPDRDDVRYPRRRPGRGGPHADLAA